MNTSCCRDLAMGRLLEALCPTAAALVLDAATGMSRAAAGLAGSLTQFIPARVRVFTAPALLHWDVEQLLVPNQQRLQAESVIIASVCWDQSNKGCKQIP